MELKVERTSNMSWNSLEEIIPPDYMSNLKQECINEKRITLYTAGEEGKGALAYLLLTPVHYSKEMYELAHMQVILEETGKHIGSNLIGIVAKDLKRNKIKRLCLSYDEDDEEGVLEPFFKANGFKNKSTYCIHRFNVDQLLKSVAHEKADKILATNHFKSYDELDKVQRNELIKEKKLTVNAANKGNLHFLVLDGEIVAMNGIYHMNDRIVLDDILIFDHSKLKEIILFTWSYFVEYVCDTCEDNSYSSVEIVVPTINYEEASLRLIGEPISKTIKQKMALEL